MGDKGIKNSATLSSFFSYLLKIRVDVFIIMSKKTPEEN